MIFGWEEVNEAEESKPGRVSGKPDVAPEPVPTPTVTTP